MSLSQTTIPNSPDDTGTNVKSYLKVVDLSTRRTNTGISNLSEEPDEYTLIYEAHDRVKRISPSVDIQPGYRAKVTIRKEKIYPEIPSVGGNNLEDTEYNSGNRILKEYLNTLKQLNSYQEQLSSSKEEISTLRYENEKLKQEQAKDSLLINHLRKELASMEIKPLKNLIIRIYGYLIPLLALLSLISGLSLVGFNFIPNPIDKTIFWSCLAGATGLYLDYFTKDKRYND